MADVARGHGGDGGSNPPPGPNRLPRQCGSSGSSNKRKRGKSSSLNLTAAVRANGDNPLSIDFSKKDQTYNVVGVTNGKLFPRCIGNAIRAHVPLYYPKWEKVPGEEKTKVYKLLEQSFDLASWKAKEDWSLVEQSIEMTMSRLYVDSRSRKKTEWLKKGDGARPENYSDEQWEALVKFFKDPDNMARGEINRRNRLCQTTPSYHGSRTFSAHRYAKAHPVTKEPEGLIENYRSMHTKNGIWVNDIAQTNYERMLAKKDELISNLPADSDTESDNENEPPIDELAITKEILGTRPGVIRGVGRKLPGIRQSCSSNQNTVTQDNVCSFTSDQMSWIQNQLSGLVSGLVGEISDLRSRLNLPPQQVRASASFSEMHTQVPAEVPVHRVVETSPRVLEDEDEEYVPETP